MSPSGCRQQPDSARTAFWLHYHLCVALPVKATFPAEDESIHNSELKYSTFSLMTTFLRKPGKIWKQRPPLSPNLLFVSTSKQTLIKFAAPSATHLYVLLSPVPVAPSIRPLPFFFVELFELVKIKWQLGGKGMFWQGYACQNIFRPLLLTATITQVTQFRL